MYTTAEAAAVIGCSAATIERWRDTGRITASITNTSRGKIWNYTKAEVDRVAAGPRPVRGRTPALPDPTEAVHLYQSGMSIRGVSAAVGVAYGTAREALINAGVTLRPHGGPRPTKQQHQDPA